MKEASLYKKLTDSGVECFLCRHRCKIGEGKRGICNVRENKGGTLYSLFYGKPVALAIDPIEKKPLYHFYPGSTALSLATLGCNFQCPFCQNWNISQFGRNTAIKPSEREVLPAEVAAKANQEGCRSIAYTYSEPTIFFEYAYDIAKEADKFGIKNIFVTNGFMTREMLDEFGPLLHAANVDLKAFNPDTYKKIIRGDLNGVLDSIRYMKELGIWIEITTLIVTEMNDSPDELKKIAGFIAETGTEIPWHISRFHPAYKTVDRGVTPAESLEAAYDIGKQAGLKYIYVGNIAAGKKGNTFCYGCGAELIARERFTVTKNLITKNGTCPKCNSKIEGVF